MFKSSSAVSLHVWFPQKGRNLSIINVSLCCTYGQIASATDRQFNSLPPTYQNKKETAITRGLMKYAFALLRSDCSPLCAEGNGSFGGLACVSSHRFGFFFHFGSFNVVVKPIWCNGRNSVSLGTLWGEFLFFLLHWAELFLVLPVEQLLCWLITGFRAKPSCFLSCGLLSVSALSFCLSTDLWHTAEQQVPVGFDSVQCDVIYKCWACLFATTETETTIKTMLSASGHFCVA